MQKIKLLIITMLALLACVGFTQDDQEYVDTSRGIDVEVGYEFDVTNALGAPYALARYSLPLTDGGFFGMTLFALPEIGVFVREPIAGYLRIQLLAEADYATWFLDCRITQTNQTNNQTCRAGARFGF